MLSVEHLSVDYVRRGQIVHAVQDVSLTVAAGEAVGLVGESGSGKSTVALAILRLIRPNEGRITQGKILFEGKDLLGLSEEEMRAVRGRRIAMIFQDPFTALNPVLRIREQMEEGLRAHGQEVSRAQLERFLEQVQLDPGRTLEAYPHQLSGGQRQRVLIAAAIAGQPSLLLADEPTTALDVLVQKDILDLLFRLQRELKLSIILVSHNLAVIGQYTQRIVVMQGGRVVESGMAQRLFREPQHPYTQSLIRAIPRLSV